MFASTPYINSSILRGDVVANQVKSVRIAKRNEAIDELIAQYKETGSKYTLNKIYGE